jgi:hypothetical protein
MRLVRVRDTTTAKSVLRMVLSDKDWIPDATGALTGWTKYGLSELDTRINLAAFAGM